MRSKHVTGPEDGDAVHVLLFSAAGDLKSLRMKVVSIRNGRGDLERNREWNT